MADCLSAPAFGRLHDWAGAWFMEPVAFEMLRASIAKINWPAHMSAWESKMAAGSGRQDSLTQMIPAKGGKSIAKIGLTGTLMKSASSMGGTSTVQARREINAAANDPNVQGILLAIDSPGGTVAGTAELGDAVKAATKVKPVYSFVDGLAASAAYWPAAQSDMIFAAHKMSQIGSIGTYFAAYDVSKAMEADGVKTHLFTTGPLKGMGVQGMPITDDQATHLQERVNEMQTHFDAAVKSGRGLSASELQAVRSGAVFPAADAMAKRLIDGVKSEEQAIAALAAAR